MKKLLLTVLPFSFLLNALTSGADPMTAAQEIENYCDSRLGSGHTEEKLKQEKDECIQEQTRYLEDTSGLVPEDCYNQVDAYIEESVETNADEAIDYENLLNQCKKERM